MMKLTSQVKWTLGLVLSLLVLAPAGLSASSAINAKKSSSSGFSSWLTVGAGAGVATAGLAVIWAKKQWNKKNLPQDTQALHTKYKPVIDDTTTAAAKAINDGNYAAYRYIAPHLNALEDESSFQQNCKFMNYTDYLKQTHTIERSRLNLLFNDLICGNEEGYRRLHADVQLNLNLPTEGALSRLIGNFRLREENPMLEKMPRLKHYYQAQNRINQAQNKSFLSDPAGTIRRFFARY